MKLINIKINHKDCMSDVGFYCHMSQMGVLLLKLLCNNNKKVSFSVFSSGWCDKPGKQKVNYSNLHCDKSSHDISAWPQITKNTTLWDAELSTSRKMIVTIKKKKSNTLSLTYLWKAEKRLLGDSMRGPWGRIVPRSFTQCKYPRVMSAMPIARAEQYKNL